MFASKSELLKFVKSENIEFIDFKIIDIAGKWHHLSIGTNRLSEKTLNEGFGFDASNYGFKTVEKSDMVFIPDISSSFIEIIDGKKILSIIGDVYTTDEIEVKFPLDPRNICFKSEKYLKELNIADKFVVSPEFEFYVFDSVSFDCAPLNTYYRINNSNSHPNGYELPLKGGYQAVQPADRLFAYRNELVSRLEKTGFPVKYHHHEVGGNGQIEIEVDFETPTKMADNSMLLKYMAKNLAVELNKTATFMPKPIHTDAGSGLHIHMKLYKENENIFHSYDSDLGLSECAMYFIGGILEHSRALSAITSPSTNSYKRLVPGFEAPVGIAFALANRSAAIRIPGYIKEPDDKRFEFRSSDATCNPYLAYSALLMAGIDGIKNKIDPIRAGFGPLNANLYELSSEQLSKIRWLPFSLEEALIELKNDNEFLLSGDVFTQDFISNWIEMKMEKEVKPFKKAPHPFEFQLYYNT